MKKSKWSLKQFIIKHKFSVMIVPENSSGIIMPRTFRFTVLVTTLMLYTTFVLFITYILLVKTPVKNYVFSDPLGFTKDEIQDINGLSSRVKTLMNEVDELKRVNQNLRNAIMLGDSSAIQSIEYDSMKRNKTGGNLYFIVRRLMSSYGIYFFDNPSFRKPIEGFTTDAFKPEAGHFGMDFSVKEGTPVYASANGYVVFAGFTVDEGYIIILAHRNNFITIYKHCSVLIKQSREKVNQGEVIALSGNSGKLSYGPHLHFEIWKDGTALDPRQFLLNY